MICLDIPMPENCGTCRLMADGWCRALQGDSHLNRYAADMEKRPDWCPLKEMPSTQLTPCDVCLRLAPCEVCRFYPPSSGDGKPCTVCPAEEGEQA